MSILNKYTDILSLDWKTLHGHLAQGEVWTSRTEHTPMHCLEQRIRSLVGGWFGVWKVADICAYRTTQNLKQIYLRDDPKKLSPRIKRCKIDALNSWQLKRSVMDPSSDTSAQKARQLFKDFFSDFATRYESESSANPQPPAAEPAPPAAHALAPPSPQAEGNVAPAEATATAPPSSQPAQPPAAEPAPPAAHALAPPSPQAEGNVAPAEATATAPPSSQPAQPPAAEPAAATAHALAPLSHPAEGNVAPAPPPDTANTANTANTVIPNPNPDPDPVVSPETTTEPATQEAASPDAAAGVGDPATSATMSALPAVGLQKDWIFSVEEQMGGVFDPRQQLQQLGKSQKEALSITLQTFATDASQDFSPPKNYLEELLKISKWMAFFTPKVGVKLVAAAWKEKYPDVLHILTFLLQPEHIQLMKRIKADTTKWAFVKWLALDLLSYFDPEIFSVSLLTSDVQAECDLSSRFLDALPKTPEPPKPNIQGLMKREVVKAFKNHSEALAQYRKDQWSAALDSLVDNITYQEAGPA